MNTMDEVLLRSLCHRCCGVVRVVNHVLQCPRAERQVRPSPDMAPTGQEIATEEHVPFAGRGCPTLVAWDADQEFEIEEVAGQVEQWLKDRNVGPIVPLRRDK